MAGIWVRSGTVTLTSGSKKVTGSGTAWNTGTNKVNKGCAFMYNNIPYEVDYVNSDTELYLVDTYTGVTGSGLSYRIQTTVTDTIPELSSRIASALAYWNSQGANLQALAVGSGNVTLTAPDGTQVTIPSYSGMQPKDAMLTALAALTTSADTLPYFTGPDTVAQTALTPLARSILACTGQSSVLSTIGGASIGQLQSGSASYAADEGTANAYVVSLAPALTARGEGQIIRFKVKNANTGASTLDDGRGPAPLVGGAHSALQGGEMAAGGDAWAQWNSTVGTGSYLLLFCTGAAEQVADATKSHHAVNLGQLATAIGTTPAQFDSSKKLATTEFAQSIGLKLSTGGSGITTSTTIATSVMNSFYEFQANGVTATLPPIASVPVGSTVTFRSSNTHWGYIKGNASEVINDGSGYSNNTFKLSIGETATFVSNGASWYLIMGGFDHTSFTSLLTTSGYQKLPGGLIIQWCAIPLSTAIASGGNIAITFPIAFPNGPLAAALTPDLAGTGSGYICNMMNRSATGATLVVYYSSQANSFGQNTAIIIGY